MDLSVKDIAKLLNVSEKTIYRMIRSETIPCFRVGGQWRFDRGEINSWIEDTRNFSRPEGQNVEADREAISLAEFLRRGGIYHRVGGDTKQDAIRSCLSLIGSGIPDMDTVGLFDSVMDRETLCPTAVGHGIALPHPRSFGHFTVVSYLALCFLEKPIPFGALDNEDVDTLFFIFPRSERRFLRIQTKLLRLLKDDEILTVIADAPPADKVYEVFSRKESEIFGGAPE
jgi:PTS system nitrogen regulatory IIA component